MALGAGYKTPINNLKTTILLCLVGENFAFFWGDRPVFPESFLLTLKLLKSSIGQSKNCIKFVPLLITIDSSLTLPNSNPFLGNSSKNKPHSGRSSV